MLETPQGREREREHSLRCLRKSTEEASIAKRKLYERIREEKKKGVVKTSTSFHRCSSTLKRAATAFPLKGLRWRGIEEKGEKNR